MNVILFRTWVLLLLAISANKALLAEAPELDDVPLGAFTIAVIPDTQKYVVQAKTNSEDGDLRNDVFASITDWIVKHRVEQNIVFVSHVGDIVDLNVPEQWTVAKRCIDRLHGVVPYGLTVGNHDMVRSGDSSLFQRTFPESRFKKFDWYGGSFRADREQQNVSGNNANSFQRFSVGTLDFLFLHLECNAPDDVLAWADQVIREHPQRRVICTTHMDLGPIHRPKTVDGYITDPKGRMQWNKCHSTRGNTAVEMWNECFKKHANLFMICSGDQSRTQAKHIVERGVNGNAVHSCLCDYSSDGSLRLYRFTPAKNRVDAITYNVIRHELTRKTKLVADEGEHQFSFEYVMSK